jgi:hypothetical protein
LQVLGSSPSTPASFTQGHSPAALPPPLRSRSAFGPSYYAEQTARRAVCRFLVRVQAPLPALLKGIRRRLCRRRFVHARPSGRAARYAAQAQAVSLSKASSPQTPMPFLRVSNRKESRVKAAKAATKHLGGLGACNALSPLAGRSVTILSLTSRSTHYRIVEAPVSRCCSSNSAMLKGWPQWRQCAEPRSQKFRPRNSLHLGQQHARRLRNPTVTTSGNMVHAAITGAGIWFPSTPENTISPQIENVTERTTAIPQNGQRTMSRNQRLRRLSNCATSSRVGRLIQNILLQTYPFLNVSAPSWASTTTVSPSVKVPSSSFMASAFCNFCWMTRLTGLAPSCGS